MTAATMRSRLLLVAFAMAAFAVAAVACAAGDVEVSTSPTPPSPDPSVSPTATAGEEAIPADEIVTYEWRIAARLGEDSQNLRLRLAGGYDRETGLAVMDVEVLVPSDVTDFDVDEAPTRPLTLVYRSDGIVATGLEPFWTEYVPAGGGPLDPDAWYAVDEAIQNPPDPSFLEPLIEGTSAVFASLGHPSPQLRDAGIAVVGGVDTRMQTARLDTETVSEHASDDDNSLAALVETTDSDELIATVWVDDVGVVRRFVAISADSAESPSQIDVELVSLNGGLDVPDPATIEELVRD